MFMHKQELCTQARLRENTELLMYTGIKQTASGFCPTLY